MLDLKHISALLLVLATSVVACKNNPSYFFGSFTRNGIEYTRTCAWITENPDETSKRRDEWCNYTINNKVVKEACPVACLKCPLESHQTTNLRKSMSQNRPLTKLHSSTSRIIQTLAR